MKALIPYIIQQAETGSARYEVKSFPSGAFMIDIRIADRLYHIQIDGNEIRLSEVTEDTGPFDNIPDQSFTDAGAFKQAFELIFQRTPKKPTRETTGMTNRIIILVVFLASVINPYLIVFPIPLFLIALIFIWMGKNSILSKMGWTIAPLLLYYPIMLLYFYVADMVGTAIAQKLDFIHPYQFEGQVTIIEDMPCGQPVRKIDGREQLEVPASGILLYQGKLKADYVNHHYYRLTQDGQKGSLSRSTNSDNKPSNPDTQAVEVRLLGTGYATNVQGKTYSYMGFLVASSDSSGNYFATPYTRQRDDLKDNLVNNCK